MKRLKYSNLLILGVFIYIIFQIILLLISKSTGTLVLKKENIEEKTTIKGLFIREEYLVKSDIKGQLALQVKDGQKIKSGQVIGEVYNNRDKIEENNIEIERLNNEIEKLERQKDSEVNSIILTQIKTKKEQVQLLENQINKNTFYINSPNSGIVSYKYDRNEQLYSLDRLDSLTEEDIKNASNNYGCTINDGDNIKRNQIIARVINNNESYVVICVDKEEAKKYNENKFLKIKFNNDILEVQAKKVYQNNDDTLVILKITNQNVEIYDTRIKEFDIIYNQVEGLKIAKSCIKKLDNKKGVYVINQQTKKVEFVELKNIQYENEDFIFIDDYKNSIEGIKTVRVNDEVILKPNSINTNIRIK